MHSVASLGKTLLAVQTHVVYTEQVGKLAYSLSHRIKLKSAFFTNVNIVNICSLFDACIEFHVLVS